MSNFDINKHKNFEVITKQEVEKEGFPDKSVKLYMDEIIKNKYIYTLEDIEDKLDFKIKYLQKRLNKLDTLYIDYFAKSMIKDYVSRYEFYLDLEKRRGSSLEDAKLYAITHLPDEFRDGIEYLQEHKKLLQKRVLVSEDSIYKFMLEHFKKEVVAREYLVLVGYDIDLEGNVENVYQTRYEYKYEDFTMDEIKEFWENGVVATAKAKEKFNIKHDTQLKRLIENKSHIKICIFEDRNKTKNIRYYFKEDEN